MSDIFGKISIEPEKPAASKKKRKRQPPTKRKTDKNREWTKNLIWFIFPIGLIALYSITGFWGVPYYLNTSIPKLATHEYSVVVSPGKITFNPFSFTLKTESTKINDLEGKPIAHLPHLELKLAPIQLLRMDFVCTKVALTSPSLNLVRNEDGSYNFSSLLPTLKDNTNGVGMIGFSDLPFFFSLNNISINDGTLTFNDKPNKKTHNIQDIELQLPTLANLDFQADNYISPHFSAVVNGSPVTFKAQTNKNETSNTQSLAQLAWEMKDFPLQNYVSYLPFDFPFSINKGTAEGIVGLNFDNLNKKDGKLSITFKLAIADIDFETHSKTLQLQSPIIHITGSFSPIRKLFIVKDLRFESPQFTAHTPHLLKELSDIFVIQKKTNQLGIVEEPVVFSLQSLQFTNGKLSHQRTLNKKEVPFEWIKLEANIRNYITDESKRPVNNKPSTVNLSGQKRDKTNVFSYVGSFESPSTLNGKLSVDIITCQNLFSFILPEQDPTIFKGSAKFDSWFSITERNETETFNSYLSQTNVTIENLYISEKDKPVLEAEELSLSGALLTGDKVNLGRVKVKNGSLFYTQKSNSSILSKIISGQYSISKLDYTGNVSIRPKDRKAIPFALEKTSIQYSGTNSSPKNGGEISISGLTGTHGKIDATGTVGHDPFNIALSTAFTEVDNATLTAIFPDNNFITNSTGTISGKGDFTFPRTAFTGNLTLINGMYEDSKEQRLSWNTFNLEDVNFTSQPYHLGVSKIKLNKPQFIISIQSHKGSMDQQLSEFLRNTLRRNQPETAKQKKVSISPIDIQKITINDGSLTINDHRLAPTWTGEPHSINGTIENIHSASSANNSSFIFTGRFGEADFSWRGAIDPFKDTQTDKQHFTLKNYPLNNFAKQLLPLSDMNFDSATISLTYSSDWINGDLSHSLRSSLSQLKIDNPNSESALPLALLADINGNMKMDSSAIQVSPKKDSNLFDYLTGNWQKLMVKSSLSPLLLVTGNFSDLMDNDFIDFKPGLFMLSDAGRKALLRYGALLVAHPNIKLRLSGGLSLKEDKNSLHKQLQKNESLRIERENEKLFAKWQSKKKEYEAQFKNNQQNAVSTGNIAESDIPNKVLAGFRPLLPEPVVVDNEMLFELAEKRLDIVKQHFMTRLSLTKGRVEVKLQSSATSKDANGKGVQIEIMPFEASVLFQDD